MRNVGISLGTSILLGTLLASCSGGGGGGDKADRDVIVGLVSGPVSEGGEQASFTVVLRARPSKDVVIPVSSADEGEGTASPATLTFTRENWDAPQTVLVTGVDDVEKDGNTSFAIALGPAQSDDGNYDAFDPDDVMVTNLDDETAAVRFGAVSGQTTEMGTQATFTVFLQSRPTADVVLIFGTSDLSEGATDVQTLTFTPDNWDSPQTVTITGLDDDLADGAQNYSILFQSAFSEDADYAFLPVDAVPVTNLDDDTAGILVTKTSGITSELGHEETYSVRLLSRPSASVLLTWTLSDTGEATFDSTTSSTMTQQFTVNNWATEQPFTIIGDDDSLADGDQTYTVSVTSVTSQDTTYTLVDRPLINLVNVDDDIAGFIVTPPSGPTAETGGSSTFTVSLRGASSDSVTVDLASTNAKEATVTPSSLTLTTTPQTVTVKGTMDYKRDGHKPFAVTFTPAVSTDMAYSGMQIPNVGLTNIDDGPVKRVVVHDDAYGTQADDAADELGYTLVQTSDFTGLDNELDSGDLDLVILELTTSLLPAATESRLIGWISSGGSIILSHWDLASHPSLEAALEVSSTPFTSNNRLFLPASDAEVDLFADPNPFPAPLIGDQLAGDIGNELVATMTTGGHIAVRFDDPSTGPGAIAVTRFGSAIVNGFSPDDIGAGVDAEPLGFPAGDGIPDLRELYMNEIALSAKAGSTESRFDNNTPVATVYSNVNGGIVTSPLTVSGASNFSKVRVSMYFPTTNDFNDFDFITLISPAGTRIALSIRNPNGSGDTGPGWGSSCDDAGRTFFDDDAPTSIEAAASPFVGSFQPSEPLAPLAGTDPNGTWQIEIHNEWTSDDGVLQCWSLHFE